MGQSGTEANPKLKLEERTDRTVIVSGDGNRLKQVFLNIVDNAIKFSHEQGWIHLVISVKEDGRAMVEVVDTGIGISEEYLHKVKDRFFQVNHQGGGTGLGLAISQQIVEPASWGDGDSQRNRRRHNRGGDASRSRRRGSIGRYRFRRAGRRIVCRR